MVSITGLYDLPTAVGRLLCHGEACLKNWTNTPELGQRSPLESQQGYADQSRVSDQEPIGVRPHSVGQKVSEPVLELLY